METLSKQSVEYEPGFEGGGWAGGGHLGVFRTNMTFGAMRENGATKGVSVIGKQSGSRTMPWSIAKFKLEHGVETSNGT